MRQGVITDFLITERMLRYFIQKAMGRRAFRKPRISICVPSGVTEVERKAVEEATYQAGAPGSADRAGAGGSGNRIRN